MKYQIKTYCSDCSDCQGLTLPPTTYVSSKTSHCNNAIQLSITSMWIKKPFKSNGDDWKLMNEKIFWIFLNEKIETKHSCSNKTKKNCPKNDLWKNSSNVQKKWKMFLKIFHHLNPIDVSVSFSSCINSPICHKMLGKFCAERINSNWFTLISSKITNGDLWSLPCKSVDALRSEMSK